MHRAKSMLVAASLIGTVVFAPGLAWADSPGAKSGTTKAGTSAPVGKAQQCVQMKKKIADYEAAVAKAPKGAKVAGVETIKSDIAWVKANC